MNENLGIIDKKCLDITSKLLSTFDTDINITNIHIFIREI